MWVKSIVLKYLMVILAIMAFLTLLLGGNCCPVPTPFTREAKNYFKQTKEMAIDRRLANIAGPLLQVLYCPSLQKLTTNNS